MPVEVIMPKVDMDMATGTLSAWHAAEGEAVQKGAPLFDIETDKAAMEVESPASGRLHHIVAAPGQTVDVGSPVAWIYAEGEAVGSVPSPAAAAAPAPAPEVPAPAPAAASAAAPAAAAGARRPSPRPGSARPRSPGASCARRASRSARSPAPGRAAGSSARMSSV